MFKNVMCCALFILFFGSSLTQLHAREFNMTDCDLVSSLRESVLQAYLCIYSRKKLDVCGFDGKSFDMEDYFEYDFEALVNDRGIAKYDLLYLAADVKGMIGRIAITDSSILNDSSCSVYEYVRLLIEFYDNNKVFIYCEYRELADLLEFIKTKLEDEAVTSRGDVNDEL